MARFLIVDAVSSFAGMDIHPEDCAADIFITGPGKCLGGAPGLTIMAVSDRAWKHMEANPKAPRASVLSLLDWKEAWRQDQPFPFTPSIAEVNGLDAALDQYLEEGPEPGLASPCADGQGLPRRPQGHGAGALGRRARPSPRRPPRRCAFPPG